MAEGPPDRPGVTGSRPDLDLVAEGDVTERTRDLVPVPRQLTSVEGPSEARRSDVDAWGRSEHLRQMTRRLYDPMYKHWFRVEWEHFDRLPETGGALLVANHAGAIPPDAPAIMHGIETQLGRRVYGLAENLFRAIPVVGTLWARGGGVAAHPDNAYRLLHDEGQLVLVFPEGTKATGKRFTERYQLHRFGRGGFFEIAMRAGVTVMGPLGLVGYFPTKFRLRVLPPVHFDVAPGQERYSRSRVMDESERIRVTVQEALYDMLRTRRSVWFG